MGSTVDIGVLAPLTPPGWVDAGRHLVAGMRLAVADVNGSGGFDGRPLSLQIGDTAAYPAKAERAVEDFERSGVVAVAGEFHSVVAHSAAARAAAIGLPFLCSSAVIDTLLESPSDLVARLAPPQSVGWTFYAEHLLEAGRRRIVLASQGGVYWESGVAILRDRLADRAELLVLDADEHGADGLREEALRAEADAFLILTGFPRPAVDILAALRGDPRLGELLVGTPAGQAELAGWWRSLGTDGAGVPFLRYMPAVLPRLGSRFEARARAALGEPPSFVAFEGYDTILALAASPGLTDRSPDWSQIRVEGTRAPISFTRPAGTTFWQWPHPPVQVAQRDPDTDGEVQTL